MNTTTIRTWLVSMLLLAGCAGASAAPAPPVASCGDPPSMAVRRAATLEKASPEPMGMCVEH